MPSGPASAVFAEPGDLAAAARAIARVVGRAGAKRIAMPGGSTAPRVLGLLDGRGLDWRGTAVVPTDDRQVAPDHPASNLGLLRNALAGSGAEVVALREGEIPARFDLVWLGMGEDGHVASLFPRMTASGSDGPRVIATLPDPLPREAPYPRLSLNLASLTATGELMIVATGPAKRSVLEAALAGTGDLPITRLMAAATCPVTIYWTA